MFSYPDAARYRVGPNYQQLPSNRAKHVYSPFQRDGIMRADGNYGPDPHYVRSTFRPLASLNAALGDVAHDKWVGEVCTYTSEVTDEDFAQPRDLWALFKKWGQDEMFIDNICGHLKKALPQVQKETIKMFAKVDPEIGERIEKTLGDFLGMKGVDHVSAKYGLQEAYGGGY
jgi:catalase